MLFGRKKVIMAVAVAFAAVFVLINQIGASSLGKGASKLAGHVPATEAFFGLDSPAAGPFPSDWFTVPDHTNITHRRVSLPLPDCQVYVSDCEDLAVINELDGFNLQPRLSVPFSGPINPGTVTSDTLFLVSLGSAEPGEADMPQGTVVGRGRGEYRRSLSEDESYMPWGKVVGINQVVWDALTNTLHVESDELLAQHTRFALIVTRGILDAGGAPVGASDAFRRFRANVHTEYKQALLSAIQAARQAGVREEDIAVASVFTTQSATAVLEKIRDQIHAAMPDPADFLLGPNGERTVFNLNDLTGITSSQQTKVDPPVFNTIPVNLSLVKTTFPGAVGSVAFGRYLSPDYQVHPGQYIPPVGTRSGIPVVQGTNDIYFNLFLPSGPKPAHGWPVVIFGHGVNDNKDNALLSVASSLANNGLATIGINMVGHGFGLQSTLTVTRTGVVPVTFVAGGRGFDQDGNNTIGSSEGLNAARPRSIVFPSDGFRQTAADLMQLARVIEVGMDVDGDGQRDLDSSRIYLFGISYGGAMGTVFLAVEPNVRAGVLVVPADPVPIGRLGLANRSILGAKAASRQPSILNSPGITVFAGRAVTAPFCDENMPLRDQVPLTVQLADLSTRVIQSPVTNTVAGAMAIQEMLENGEWVCQAGSPAAYAPHLRRAPLAGVPAKPVIFQIVKGDESAPNPTTTAILRAGELADMTLYYRHDLNRSANPSLPTNAHGFVGNLINPLMRPIALGAQDQTGKFFSSDGGLVIIPGPSPYFEFPIPLPLPEGLNYMK
jgi:pimeloyl-ACP methyl ester carboxylesterase